MDLKVIRHTSFVLFLLSTSAAGQIPVAQTSVYDIAPESSILRVYVGRAGVLARMGHNHVIHTRDLSGTIILADNRDDSSASFSFPVDSLTVDDPEERDRAGEDYESEPDESAIAGTRRNMLGAGVLNSEEFPVVEATVTTVTSAQEQWQFDVQLQVQDSNFSYRIPASVTINGDVIAVQAELTLNHEQLGLSPFTALGGALRVAEDLDFEIAIVAIARSQ